MSNVAFRVTGQSS